MMFKFLVFVACIAMPVLCADDTSHVLLEMQNRLNSFERKFQDMERSNSRVENIVSGNTAAMETFGEILGRRYTEPSRIELYVSQQQAILSTLPKLQQTMEKMLDNIQSQMKTQTENFEAKIRSQTQKMQEQINSSNEKMVSQINTLNDKMEKQINSQTQKMQEHINSSNEKMEKQINSQTLKMQEQINSLNEKMSSQINSLNEKMGSQINNQTKKINYMAEEITTQLNDAIRSTKERVEQHEEEFVEAKARMTGMENLLEHFGKQADDQNVLLEKIASIVTAKKNEPSHLLDLKHNQETMKNTMQSMNEKINNNLQSIDGKVNSNYNNIMKINKELIKNVAIELFRSKHNLKDDKKIIMKKASQEGDIEVVRALLDLGYVGVNDIVDDDSTGLHWAVWKNHANVVSLLLDRGADVNLRETHPDGWTPLMYAARDGSLESAQVLVARGADKYLRSTDSSKRTALRMARDNNHQDMIKYLVSVGVPE